MKNNDGPCRVLFVLGSMEVGGVQSGIMNFAKICDPEKVRFDVLVHTDKIGFHEEEFKQYGQVFHMPIRSNPNTILNMLCQVRNNRLIRKNLRQFLKEHPEYGAVHSKSLEYSAPVVEAAKDCGIPVRIAQSHVDKPPRLNPFHSWYYRWCAGRIERCATKKLAVSPKAVDLMFCKFGGKVIRNPTISLKRLDPSKYDPKPHEGIRMIQIGTYSRRKNQIFSLEILRALLDSGEKASLTFVGFPFDEPDYIDLVKAKTEELGLTENVTFLPKDSDVPYLLSESDLMLIPSLREGLPNVALEAQAMGVPCWISDTVNPDTDCGLCRFLSLEKGASFWAENIAAYRQETGLVKRYVDMSSWDNELVSQEYIKMWRNE